MHTQTQYNADHTTACIHNTVLISILYGHTYTMLTALMYVVHQGLANIHIDDNVWIEGWTAFLKELGDC